MARQRIYENELTDNKFSVCFPPSLRQKLDALAHEMWCTRGDVLRRLLEDAPVPDEIEVKNDAN